MRGFTFFAGLLLVGCGSEGELDRSEAEMKAIQLGHNCHSDTDIVPIERSGNCLALLRLTKQAFENRPVCNQGVEECTEPDDYISVAGDAYVHAIANSLWHHGKPSDERLEGMGLEPETSYIFLYRNLDLMEQLFADCLALEREQTRLSFPQSENSGFQQTTTVWLHDLKEGQLCFREGYTVANPI